MKPACHNHSPLAAGAWQRAGYRGSDLKPILRWRAKWYVDRCTLYDGPQQYAVFAGYDCTGCKWLPEGHKREAEETTVAALSAKAIDFTGR